MFVEDFVMKMEVEGRDRELDPGRAEDVTCPGEAQDAVISKCVGVFWMLSVSSCQVINWYIFRIECNERRKI